MQNNAQNNDLQQIITQALDELKREQGEKFDPDRVNLAELARRTTGKTPQRPGQTDADSFCTVCRSVQGLQGPQNQVAPPPQGAPAPPASPHPPLSPPIPCREC